MLPIFSSTVLPGVSPTSSIKSKVSVLIFSTIVVSSVSNTPQPSSPFTLVRIISEVSEVSSEVEVFVEGLS